MIRRWWAGLFARRSQGQPPAAPGEAICPLCGAATPFNPRYPRAVCHACAAKVTDERGRPVRFYNASPSGGLEGRYADGDEPYPSGRCWIDGTPCQAQEAHLGGVVVCVLAEGEE